MPELKPMRFVLRHLQSAQDVSQRSSKHLRALDINSLVAAHHMTAEHNPALPEKGRKRHDIVRASLQRKPARRQVLVPQPHLHSKKLSAAPEMPTHSSRNHMGRFSDFLSLTGKQYIITATDV